VPVSRRICISTYTAPSSLCFALLIVYNLRLISTADVLRHTHHPFWPMPNPNPQAEPWRVSTATVPVQQSLFGFTLSSLTISYLNHLQLHRHTGILLWSAPPILPTHLTCARSDPPSSTLDVRARTPLLVFDFRPLCHLCARATFPLSASVMRSRNRSTVKRRHFSRIGLSLKFCRSGGCQAGRYTPPRLRRTQTHEAHSLLLHQYVAALAPMHPNVTRQHNASHMCILGCGSTLR
jgi:hypothetical protein